MAGLGYLRLSARFIAGRYGGDEWPPAPWRLLQAIVAGCRSIEAPGLAWLERQPAPSILAEEEPEPVWYRRAIPNNADPRKPQAQQSMRTVVRRQVTKPVHYCWALNSTVDAAEAARLLDSARRVHTLGTGEDMCSIDGEVGVPAPQSAPGIVLWQPPQAGADTLHRDGDTLLRTALPGSLHSVEERFQAFQRRLQAEGQGYARPIPAPAMHAVTRYRRSEHQPRQALLALRLLQPDGSGEFRRFHAEEAVLVAGMLRHAAMRLAAHASGSDETLADFAAGHPGGGDADARLSWVPLPSIGHTHADGLIRRALWLCRAPDAPALQILAAHLPSGPLPLVEEGSGTCIALAEAVSTDNEPVLGAYLRRARIWTTVTPIVLPGDYGGGRLRTMTRLLHKALRESGIDPGLVEAAELSPHPLSRQAARIAHTRLKDWQARNLILTHARIRFRTPLHGPIVLGRGRHYGLGLLGANPE